MRSTYLPKNGLSTESIISSFVERKEKNKSIFSSIVVDNPKFTFISDEGKEIPVITDEKGKVTHSFCSYCLKKVEKNPWKNGAYVFTSCVECLQSCGVIEDFIGGDKTVTKKKVRTSKMKNVNEIEIKWEEFESLVSEKKAKLSLLAKEFSVYPMDLKNFLVKKYGEKIVFKKGRNGGIYWS